MFKPNPRFDEELFLQAQLEQIVKQAGKKVQSAAQGYAAQASDTGASAASVTGKFARGRKGRPHYYVYMEDEGAQSIEFGTNDTPAHRPLGRAIREAG